MTPEKDFEPYGPEWEKELMKWTKKQLIEWIRVLLLSTKRDKNQAPF
jgi:hypothetical protein